MALRRGEYVIVEVMTLWKYSLLSTTPDLGSESTILVILKRSYLLLAASITDGMGESCQSRRRASSILVYHCAHILAT